MVSKLDSQTYTSEFESHWVPHSFGLVLNRSKDLRKLLSDGEASILKVSGNVEYPFIALIRRSTLTQSGITF